MQPYLFDDIILASPHIKTGKIGILKTDTIYGLVGLASDESVVERIYAVKGRTPTKSPIVLISSLDQLYDPVTEATRRYLGKFWPGKFSIILPSDLAPAWLSRGNQSVAYRLPASQHLRELIAQTGPLIAPSANPEGLAPAADMEQAKAYFDNSVDFYVDSGFVDPDTPPSELWRYDPIAKTAQRLR